MVIFYILMAILVALLIFRYVRLLRFQRQWLYAKTPAERRAGLLNFVIHLFACIFLFVLFCGTVLNLVMRARLDY